MAPLPEVDHTAVVLSAWSEVLDTAVRLDAGFLDLGGDSLKAIHVLDLLSNHLAIPEELGAIVLASLFDAADAQSFATFLGSLPLTRPAPETVPAED